MLEPGMPGAFDLDGAFEPQTRVRSNTWPCQRPEEPGSVNESGGTPPHQPPGGGPAGVGAAAGLLPVKKNSSRRNAWGNLSYADLITQAITSSTDKRLTLSQIYEWMVQHVPYFKDKGDSNSSAGWKVGTFFYQSFLHPGKSTWVLRDRIKDQRKRGGRYINKTLLSWVGHVPSLCSLSRPFTLRFASLVFLCLSSGVVAIIDEFGFKAKFG